MSRMQQINWTEVILVALGFFAVHTFNKIDSNLTQLNQSAAQLNAQMAVVVSRVDNHEGRIGSLEHPELTSRGEK